MISGTLRHEGAVVAENQEPLAPAFGQVEHQAIVPPDRAPPGRGLRQPEHPPRLRRRRSGGWTPGSMARRSTMEANLNSGTREGDSPRYGVRHRRRGPAIRVAGSASVATEPAAAVRPLVGPLLARRPHGR